MVGWNKLVVVDFWNHCLLTYFDAVKGISIDNNINTLELKDASEA